MSDDLNDAVVRVCAIESEAITPLREIDCVPHFLYSQEAFPYITHRWATTRLEGNSHDIDVQERELIARLVIGHITQAYVGETEEILNSLLPELEAAFANAPMLTSEAHPDEPDYLYPTEVRVNFNRGLAVFETSGIPEKQVGSEFSIFVPMFAQINVLNTTPPSP